MTNSIDQMHLKGDKHEYEMVELAIREEQSELERINFDNIVPNSKEYFENKNLINFCEKRLKFLKDRKIFLENRIAEYYRE